MRNTTRTATRLIAYGSIANIKESEAIVQKRVGRYTMALYKQAGNSIPVTIFESIFRKMLSGETKGDKESVRS